MNVTLALTPDLDARLARIEAMLAAMQPPDLVGTSEAARILNVAPRTVRAMVASGELPCIRVRGAIKIRRTDLGLA